jgi:formylmethanofuran dehydrogenase subunit C
MSSLTLKLKLSGPSGASSGNSQRLNLCGIVPHRLLDKSIQEIRDLELKDCDSPAVVGDLFEVSEGQRDRLALVGLKPYCDFVGGDMQSGWLDIEGTVGDHVASGMRGGTLTIAGSTGQYACSGLRGGRVIVQGNIGDFAAAAPPGKLTGMSGGSFVVEGSCGRWLGSRMRRGTVVINGSVDLGCASRMIAGTIAIAGEVAMPFGYGMARGTVMLMAADAWGKKCSPPGFTDFTPCESSFFPMLVRAIYDHAPWWELDELLSCHWHRALGDRAEGGYGEILMRATVAELNSHRVGHA